MIYLKCALVGIASGTVAIILSVIACLFLLLLWSRAVLGLDGLPPFGVASDALPWVIGSFVLVWLIGFVLGFVFTWRHLTVAV